MAVTPEQIEAWCRKLIGADPQTPQPSLQECLAAIPRLDQLADVPRGTPVLVRGDVDCKPGKKIGEEDIRLRSMLETLRCGQQRGWKLVVFGHVGRKPEGSLAPVSKRLGELLECDVPLVDDWLDEPNMTIGDKVRDAIGDASPGSVMVLQNTRKYEIERALWEAGPEDLPPLAGRLARLCNEFHEKIAAVYVNEALSAGSLDVSTTVIPAAMDRVGLGDYVAREFEGPMMRCLETQLVVFSGLKIEKLDDLQAMIARGKIRRVIAAGSLAMALKKAAAELDGGEFGLGVAEDPAHRDKPYFIPPERVEQARRMISEGRQKGIEFFLPVDFVLGDGRASETIGPGEQQFDVGPKTSELFELAVGRFIDEGASGRIVFHNGVFGMFEDPRFEHATRRFMGQLKRLTDAGALVYVGGGEGGAALARYGREDWVTHVFTAGGTVLAALAGQPIPYLVALRMASRR